MAASALESSVPVESICTTDANSKSGALEWRIKRWSSLPSDHVVGPASQGRTTSMTMEAAGDKWQIQAMPGGKSMASDTSDIVRRNKEHVGIFLNYKGESEALRTNYSITVVNQLPPGTARPTSKTISDSPRTFGQVENSTTDTGRGFPCAIKRSILEDETQGWKVNDCVIIRITITTFGDLESTVAAPTVFTPHSTLAADVHSLFASGRASDITLTVGLREFAAHRTILRARSPYFEGLFSSSMRDADSDGLPIADVEPDVFEQLLSWIYTGEVTEAALQAKDMLEHLIMAANRYECGGLKLLCEAKLCEGLTVENVATRLVLAEQAEADQLMECSLEFIKPNAAAVMGTEGWKHVVSGGGELMNEVLAFIVGAPSQTTAGAGKKRKADEAGLSAQDAEVNAEVDEMRAWKISRLRDELQRRGLDTKGRKPELVGRLEQVVRDRIRLAEEARAAAGKGKAGGGSSSSGGSSSRSRFTRPAATHQFTWNPGSAFSSGSFSSSFSSSTSSSSSGGAGAP